LPRPEIFVDTDVMISYLDHDSPAHSLLRKQMSYSVCFTSVLNASELIAITRTDDERRHAESVLWGLKVLGFHHKYSLTFGDIHRTVSQSGSPNPVSIRNSMVAGICALSDLPLATYSPAAYRLYKDLRLVSGVEAAQAHSWEELQEFMITI